MQAGECYDSIPWQQGITLTAMQLGMRVDYCNTTANTVND
jgi:hypothetical protein